MKFIFFLISSVFAFEQLSNELKKGIASDLLPYAEMKMRSLSRKAQKIRVYKIVEVQRDLYPFEIFANVATGGVLATDKNGCLEENFDLEHLGENGRTPAWIAACRGHTEHVKFLAEKNVDLNRVDRFRYTPVSKAAQNGHTEIVKFLAEQKVDLNLADTTDVTPAWSAAFSGHTEIVKILAEQKADLEHPDIAGRAPVWAAAMRGHTEIVKILAEQNVNLNQPNNEGRSPISKAAERGHTEIVEFLIKKNVNLDEKLLEKDATWTEEIRQLIYKETGTIKESQPESSELTPKFSITPPKLKETLFATLIAFLVIALLSIYVKNSIM